MTPGAVVRRDGPAAARKARRAPLPGRTPVEEISGALPLAEARDAFERRYLSRVLAETKGNVSRAAERLGLDRTTLHRKDEGARPRNGDRDPG